MLIDFVKKLINWACALWNTKPSGSCKVVDKLFRISSITGQWWSCVFILCQAIIVCGGVCVCVGGGGGGGCPLDSVCLFVCL